MKRSPIRRKSKNPDVVIRKKCVELAKKIRRTLTPKCAYCDRGKPDVAIHAHHIYNEKVHQSMSADLDNLITVCYSHHIGGYNAKEPAFHANPQEMADWFLEHYPDLHNELRLRSQTTQRINWYAKYEELKAQAQEIGL